MKCGDTVMEVMNVDVARPSIALRRWWYCAAAAMTITSRADDSQDCQVALRAV